MLSSGAGSSADALAEEPPALRPKPQRRSNVGTGKLYADEAAFVADVAAWELEREQRKQRMAERKAALDRLRDRSGRQRDGEDETDCERRVRVRRESPAAAAQHAQQQAARRGTSRLEQQQAWVHDVGVFAAVFRSAEPRRHALAYSAHRPGDWLKDGEQILALHE